MNRILIRYDGTNAISNKSFIIKDGSSDERNFNLNLDTTILRKLVSSYNSDSFIVSGQGNLSGEIVPDIPLNVSSLFIGNSRLQSTSRLNGHIKRLTYWPARLDNTLLQNITR